MNRRLFLNLCGLVGGWSLSRGALLAGPSPGGRAAHPPRIRFEKIRLDLKHAWTIARGTAEYKENVMVYYERDGLTGIGEAGHLTAAGQTADQTLQGCAQLVSLYEQADPFAFHDLPAAAVQLPGVTAPARAAMEMALLDWVGQSLRQPWHRLWGLDPLRMVPTSFTIGLDRPEVMQAKVREADAFKILKVKLGRDDDEAIVKALRAVTDKPLRADANEGWRDKETAIRRLEWLSQQGVELVEQPLPRGMIEETRWLKARCQIPLVADESVHMAADIPALAGAFSGINVKIMKAGGVLEAMRMFEVARAHGLDAMLGCMIETSVAITAGAHIQSLAKWVDLDGSLLLKADPFTGATFVNGGWQAPVGAGFGVKRKG